MDSENGQIHLMKCRINIDNEKFKKINNNINKNRLYKSLNIGKYIYLKEIF